MMGPRLREVKSFPQVYTASGIEKGHKAESNHEVYVFLKNKSIFLFTCSSHRVTLTEKRRSGFEGDL